jgi:hypothetical protein
MPMKFWKLPLYPLLIAAYYPLYMMASDQGGTDVSEVIRPTAVCVLLALLLMVLLGAILRDMHRAALWAAITVVLIFGFRFVQSGSSAVWLRARPSLPWGSTSWAA